MPADRLAEVASKLPLREGVDIGRVGLERLPMPTRPLHESGGPGTSAAGGKLLCACVLFFILIRMSVCFILKSYAGDHSDLLGGWADNLARLFEFYRGFCFVDGAIVFRSFSFPRTTGLTWFLLLFQLS